MSLIVSGCSDAPKEPLSVNDEAPVNSAKNKSYAYRPYRPLRKHNFKTAATHKNTVWERLLSLYSLPDIKNPRIDHELYWYLDHPASLAVIQQRAEPYLHHILDEIEAKNIPGELALLPVVESAFVPDAYSSADASGLWQFIPSTGREFGLMQNDWYDGRRDIYASTKAATTYLKQLSDNFDGDWLLALASYNCGKGRVQKSIDRNSYLNLPTDYWSLDLPQETENYVPRLLAIAKLFANADEYNIHLQHIPNRPYFEVVDIKSPLDLHKAAQLANTPLHKFLKLNPGFSRSCTAPQGPHRLLVPVDQAQAFKKNLAMLPYSERVAANHFNPEPVAEYFPQEKHLDEVADIVYPREKVEEKVAAAPIRVEPVRTVYTPYNAKPENHFASTTNRSHSTYKAISRPTHLAINSVRPNPPAQSHRSEKTSNIPLLARATKPKSASAQVYAVKKGDTFFNISQRFSVTPKDIASWNNITLKTALIPGRKLTIKSVNPQLASASPTIRLISYTVGKGDSLMQISRKFNVSLSDLRKSNAATLVRGLHPGQKLKIIVDNNQSSS